MSHHGLASALHTIMNQRPPKSGPASGRLHPGWTSSANFARHRLPLYGLGDIHPAFRVRRGGLQPSVRSRLHEADPHDDRSLGGIPHFAEGPARRSVRLWSRAARAMQNPELLAPFVDLFIIGDGEESLPWVMEKWMAAQRNLPFAKVIFRKNAGWTCSRSWSSVRDGLTHRPFTSSTTTPTAPSPRSIARGVTFPSRSKAAPSRKTSMRSRCRRSRWSSFVQTPHDRIAIEIMRGCPWQCRFCQSTVIKRPLRVRLRWKPSCKPRLDGYRNTGMIEISLLVAFEAAIIPHFEELGQADARGVPAAECVNVSLPEACA